ncbi:hypothetical protein QN277_008392 [Acacia crassicarpa]|uniref:CCHC-type domain-containing protein n=1 Tax=Acacia crassicarpa TaxID=499986 RepID=A0AAE1M786_9FABA|nr:hypothetical protein QN277_008392 [Acacia crassicarpa]
MEVGQCSGSSKLKQVVLDLNDETEVCGGALVGRIITSKKLNIPAVISMIKKGWQMDEGVEIHELDREKLIFRFRFRDASDYARILKGRPWSVQGFLLNLQVWESCMVLQDVSFEETPFWVQFHGLPVEAFSCANARILGETVGKMVMYERPKLHGRLHRSIVRVRSLVNMHTPLVSGFWIPRRGLEPAWISVKYERLSSFCYYCGQLDHDGRRCSREDSEKEFGSWMGTGSLKTNEDALVLCDDGWCEVPFFKKTADALWKLDASEKNSGGWFSTPVARDKGGMTKHPRTSIPTVNSDLGRTDGMTKKQPSPKATAEIVTGAADGDVYEVGGPYEEDGIQAILGEELTIRPSVLGLITDKDGNTQEDIGFYGKKELQDGLGVACDDGPSTLGLKQSTGMDLMDSNFSLKPNFVVQEMEDSNNPTKWIYKSISPTLESAIKRIDSSAGKNPSKSHDHANLLMQSESQNNKMGSGCREPCVDKVPYMVEFPEDEPSNQMMIPFMGLSSVAAITRGMEGINLKRPREDDNGVEMKTKCRKLCLESEKVTEKRESKVVIFPKRKNRNFRSVKRFLRGSAINCDRGAPDSLTDQASIDSNFPMSGRNEENCSEVTHDQSATLNAGGWVGPTTGSP